MVVSNSSSLTSGCHGWNPVNKVALGATYPAHQQPVQISLVLWHQMACEIVANGWNARPIITWP